MFAVNAFDLMVRYQPRKRHLFGHLHNLYGFERSENAVPKAGGYPVIEPGVMEVMVKMMFT